MVETGWVRVTRTSWTQLVPAVYQELRRLASAYMRHERPNHTLQTTALVNEAYLLLVDQQHARWENRSQFFGVAAQLMRRVLVDHARAHNSVKRGGIAPKFSLDEAMVMAKERGSDLLAIEELLNRLAAIDPQQVRIVDLRFFAGLSVDETARVLSISDRTVKREWAFDPAIPHATAIVRANGVAGAAGRAFDNSA